MRTDAIFVVVLIAAASAPVSHAEPFRLIQRLTPENSEPADFFGGAIDLHIDGRTTTLGVRSRSAYNDTRDSHVHVFQKFSGVEVTLDEVAFSPLSHPIHFSLGQDLAVQSTPNESTRFPTVLVGLNQNSVNGVVGNGVVTTYTAADNRAGPVWTRQGDLVSSDLSPGAAYGRSIAVEGQRLIVGASGNQTGLETGDDPPYGAAYIYDRLSTGEWFEIAKLTTENVSPPNDFVGARFGTSVDVSGDTAIVGAALDGGRGSAYIFRAEQGEAWNELQKLSAPPGVLGSDYGSTVAISGETAVVHSGSSEAYVYQENEEGAWDLSLTISGPEDSRIWTGRSIALDDGVLAVGFHNDTSGWIDIYRQDESLSWQFSQQILAPRLDQQNYFGSAISIAGNLLAVTDPGSNPEATLNAGPPSEGPGEAYLYRLQPSDLSDINVDGSSNLADYRIWQEEFGSTTNLASNLNEDGIVSAADYTVWRDSRTLAQSLSAVAIPEPASLGLLVVALLGFGTRQTRGSQRLQSLG